MVCSTVSVQGRCARVCVCGAVGVQHPDCARLGVCNAVGVQWVCKGWALILVVKANAVGVQGACNATEARPFQRYACARGVQRACTGCETLLQRTLVCARGVQGQWDAVCVQGHAVLLEWVCKGCAMLWVCKDYSRPMHRCVCARGV